MFPTRFLRTPGLLQHLVASQLDSDSGMAVVAVAVAVVAFVVMLHHHVTIMM
jgi:hypothetical protein